MHRFLFLIVGLFFGFGSGFLVAASNSITLDGHDHDLHQGATLPHDPADGGEHASHTETVEIPVGAKLPELSAELRRDPVSGWNLNVQVTDFAFAPERAGDLHINGEGHAHVYVDGQKIARLYGHWMHIATLPEGAKELRVSLNANDHRALSVDGKLVETTVPIPER